MDSLILVVAFTLSLLLIIFELLYYLRGVGEVLGRLLRVVLSRPARLFNQIVLPVFAVLFIYKVYSGSNLFYLLLFLGIVEIRHQHYYNNTVVSRIILFKKLDQKDVIKTFILIRKGQSVGLGPDPFDDLE